MVLCAPLLVRLTIRIGPPIRKKRSFVVHRLVSHRLLWVGQRSCDFLHGVVICSRHAVTCSVLVAVPGSDWTCLHLVRQIFVAAVAPCEVSLAPITVLYNTAHQAFCRYGLFMSYDAPIGSLKESMLSILCGLQIVNHVVIPLQVMRRHEMW